MRTERQDEALIEAGAAGMRLARAWSGFLASLDVLEAANRAAVESPDRPEGQR